MTTTFEEQKCCGLTFVDKQLGMKKKFDRNKLCDKHKCDNNMLDTTRSNCDKTQK